MQALNLYEANLDTNYNKQKDSWELNAHGKYFKGSIELKYEAVIVAINEIIKLIRELQPELNVVLQLTITLHKDKEERNREQIWYFDFRKSGKGVILPTLMDESIKPELNVIIAFEDFILLVSGKQNAHTMFMNNKLKLKGNLIKALQIEQAVSKTIIDVKKTAKL